jgi:rhamnosyltransferase subunit B
LKRILFATIGSLGDLQPCLGLALELKRRGHSVTIAATGFYRARVEALGIAFRAMRPNWDPTDSELIAQCENLRRGPEILFRKLVLPHLRDTFDDLLAAAANADLMIAGEMVYAAPLVAEKLGLRWVSAILSPCSFFSAHDPSLLVTAPELMLLRTAGWRINRAVLEVARAATRHWWEPVRQLRREQGLNPDCDPFAKDKFSAGLVLALFSRALAAPQPDWPLHTVQPGFIFYDQNRDDASTGSALDQFLATGEAPIVFTLGSTAVHHAGDFYARSAEAARRLGRRAILLGAPSAAGDASGDVLCLPYAPYSQVFPHATVIVHQGGSGTTGQALRAGRPQLIVPFGWDQPDNGARVERAGAGLCVARASYTEEKAAAALSRLLEETRFAEIAEHLRGIVSSENGIAEACDAMMQVS